MFLKKYFISLMVLCSASAMADNHSEAALAHVNATDLKTTFSITKDNVLVQLEQYKQKILASPSINDNSEAVKLTQDFIKSAKTIAEDIYDWKNVENKYIEAIKETYSEKELLEINSWLASKYGQVFIAKQKKFMLSTIDIANYSAQTFQQRIAPVEKSFTENISKLSIK